MREVVRPLTDTGRTYLARLILGKQVPIEWVEKQKDNLLQLFEDEGISELVGYLSVDGAYNLPLPQALTQKVRKHYYMARAEELLRAKVVCEFVKILEQNGERYLLMHGTSLAYANYVEPTLRERSHTDVLLESKKQIQILEALKQSSFIVEESAVSQESIVDSSSKVTLSKEDAFGRKHFFKLSWDQISSTGIGSTWTFDDLYNEKRQISIVGKSIDAVSELHELVLACMHPALNQQSEAKLIFINDIHLLAKNMSRHSYEGFVRLCFTLKIAAYCLKGLKLSKRYFNTKVPIWVLVKLSDVAKFEQSVVSIQKNEVEQSWFQLMWNKISVIWNSLKVKN